MDPILKKRGIKYIILSILEFLLCWKIPAVIALVLTIMGMVNAGNGDDVGALNMFGYAKIALWVSFGFGIVLIALSLLGVGLIGLGSSIISGMV